MEATVDWAPTIEAALGDPGAWLRRHPRGSAAELEATKAEMMERLVAHANGDQLTFDV